MEPRQKLIWVDGMTHNEAFKLSRSIGITKADLQIYFNKIGTFPLQIINLKMNLADSIPLEEDILNAQASFDGFELKELLKWLKQSPDGVPLSDLYAVKDQGILLASPESVASFMKNVIMYHIPTREYRLMSNAFKIAIGTYERFPV